mmetsp:Transcript_5850/g.10650  ORF Transcript_5850/g.10650 Transcript_5850/m.10650 type:complete len:100 (-) Transcript_5850:275-574(-)
MTDGSTPECFSLGQQQIKKFGIPSRDKIAVSCSAMNSEWRSFMAVGSQRMTVLFIFHTSDAKLPAPNLWMQTCVEHNAHQTFLMEERSGVHTCSLPFSF